ncbi:hypothetical protein CPB86DRAFT_812301 [Serendipita vermifera]|nr:hypothetical protein CPB86DRAFT_812301 [Serendipita vermifera]
MKSLEEQKPELMLSKEHLREEIRKVLLLFYRKGYETIGYENAIKEGSITPGPYFPLTYEYGKWDGWKAIAIGVFDGPHGSGKLVKGNLVTTRLVGDCTLHGGEFTSVDGEAGQVLTSATTYGDNFFCLRAPYLYLQAWVDRDSLPLRHTAFPLEPEMSFEGEFYEIIQTRENKRQSEIGTMPFVKYEGIESALFEHFQDEYSAAFSDAHKLALALENGLRGNDLIPALLRDFRVWQTCPSDRWIKLDSSLWHPSAIPASQPGTPIGHWQRLPTEIVINVLSNSSIDDILRFTSSCRYFYHNFGNPDFLSMLLRTQLRLPLSDAYWFSPVSTVDGEVEKFCQACDQSKSSKANGMLPRSSDVSGVFKADFPLWDFFRANYPSDSMRNRRRLWRISQQFRQEWYKYRTKGYEYDVYKTGGRPGPA